MLNIFLYVCNMVKNEVHDLFNYVCKDVGIDAFQYVTVTNGE